MYRRHRQLVELLWTADGRGRQLYELAQPRRVSYDRFVDRVTDIICHGLAEGWIVAHLPSAPVPDDRAYSLEFLDPDRFAAAVLEAFQPRMAHTARTEPPASLDCFPGAGRGSE